MDSARYCAGNASIANPAGAKMARLFNWQAVIDRAATGQPGAALFTSEQRYLALDAITLMLDRWRWDVMTDVQWDEVESIVTGALSAVMENQFIGSIIWRPGDPQANELVCDGSQYQRVDYPTLYNRLAPAFIVDADNFVVPDLVGRFAYGAAGAGIGATGGSETHTLTESEMPVHTHTYTPPVPNIDIEAPGAPDLFAAGVGLPVQTGAAGAGQAHNNMPPYLGLVPCLIAT